MSCNNRHLLLEAGEHPHMMISFVVGNGKNEIEKLNLAYHAGINIDSLATLELSNRTMLAWRGHAGLVTHRTVPGPAHHLILFLDHHTDKNLGIFSCAAG